MAETPEEDITFNTVRQLYNYYMQLLQNPFQLFSGRFSGLIFGLVDGWFTGLSLGIKWGGNGGIGFGVLNHFLAFTMCPLMTGMLGSWIGSMYGTQTAQKLLKDYRFTFNHTQLLLENKIRAKQIIEDINVFPDNDDINDLKPKIKITDVPSKFPLDMYLRERIFYYLFKYKNKISASMFGSMDCMVTGMYVAVKWGGGGGMMTGGIMKLAALTFAPAVGFTCGMIGGLLTDRRTIRKYGQDCRFLLGAGGIPPIHKDTPLI